MISHRYKCIFIHVPRTGGTSLEQAIAGKLHSRLLGLGGGAKTGRNRIHNQAWRQRAMNAVLQAMRFPQTYRRIYGGKHFTAKQARKFYGSEMWDSYFTFAFVRNTWDRLVSSYRFRRNVLMYETDRQLEFSEWIRNRCSEGERERQSQLAKISDAQGEIIVDWVGRFEQLEQGFQHVCEQLELPASSLPKVYASGAKYDYTDYYDSDTRRLVAESFAAEIRQFGFRFGEPAEQLEVPAAG